MGLLNYDTELVLSSGTVDIKSKRAVILLAPARAFVGPSAARRLTLPYEVGGEDDDGSCKAVYDPSDENGTITVTLKKASQRRRRRRRQAGFRRLHTFTCGVVAARVFVSDWSSFSHGPSSGVTHCATLALPSAATSSAPRCFRQHTIDSYVLESRTVCGVCVGGGLRSRLRQRKSAVECLSEG